MGTKAKYTIIYNSQYIQYITETSLSPQNGTFILGNSADPLLAPRRTLTGHSNGMKSCTLGTNEHWSLPPKKKIYSRHVPNKSAVHPLAKPFLIDIALLVRTWPSALPNCQVSHLETELRFFCKVSNCSRNVAASPGMRGCGFLGSTRLTVRWSRECIQS